MILNIQMKHLMRYNGYTIQERQNDILDKIAKYGVESLTLLESEFLDSYSENKETETHDKIKYLESEKVFDDDSGKFKFEYHKKEEGDGCLYYIGTIYVPDLKIGSKKIEGRIEGKITRFLNGSISIDFEKNGYDIFEFCSGIECELDEFIDYVVGEIYQKNY